MNSLEIALPLGFFNEHPERDQVYKVQNKNSVLLVSGENLYQKHMASDNQASTQPTNQEGPCTFSTPRNQPYKEEFDFTPKETSLNFFRETLENDENMIIIPVPSKGKTSSASQEIASPYRAAKQNLKRRDKALYFAKRSRSATTLKPSGSLYDHGEPLCLNDNLPASLGIINLQVLHLEKKSKQKNNWLLKNNLGLASETDSIYVSTNVIRIEESKDMMGQYFELGLQGMEVPMDEDIPHPDHAWVTKPHGLKSIEGLRIENHYIEEDLEEEMETPFSESEEEGEEELEQSIPESFDD